MADRAQCTTSFLVIAASLLCAAVALKEQVTLEGAVDDDMDFDESTGPKYLQQLSNVRDVQYWGKVTVGDRIAVGVLDTGSFELVMYTQSCKTCGSVSLAYDERESSSYQKGQLAQVFSHGMRSCVLEDGFDRFHVGPFGAEKQGMWFTKDCNLPLFQHEGYTAVVGLGPPGQPEDAARQRLRKLHELEHSHRAKKEELPVSFREDKALAKQRLAAALAKPALLESFDVRIFSFCLGRGTGSPGWMIWNDETRSGKPGVHQLPVAGDQSWTVQLQHLKMNGQSVSCEDGCTALLDTGTSLLAMSTPIYDSILASLRRVQLGDAACSDLKDFPDLTMMVGGSHLVHLPPSSYIGVLYGQTSGEVEQFLHANATINGQSSCRFLAMDLGPVGQAGPLVVLGMPFFREYYTTFDLGHGSHDRSIFISKADENCKPTAAKAPIAQEAEAGPTRTVDVSKVLLPRWLEDPGGGL